jgi:TP901 family phage tail tape measure protein
MALPPLVLRVIADTSSVTAGLAKTNASMRGTAAAASRAGSVIRKAFVVGVAGGAYIAIKAAAEFDQSMRNVNSIMDLSERQFARTSQKVLEMSTRFPQSADTLAKGLYDIASSGFQGADAMKVLDASAMAASAGLSTTAASAKAITNVLNAYGLEANEAAHVSDVLFTAVDKGVLTFDDIASSVGKYAGAAAQLEIPIEQAAGAQAAMTLTMDSASEAAVALNGILKTILAPSTEMAAAFKKMGYESGQAALEGEGLVGLMEKLTGVVGDDKAKWVELFPEIRAARGAMALATADGENLNRVMEGMTDSVGATGRAMAEQAKGPAFQFTLAMNRLRKVGIEIGNRLIPILLDHVIPAFERVIDAWDSLGKGGQKLAIQITGLVAGFALFGPIIRRATIGVMALGRAMKLSTAAGGAWAVSLALVAEAARRTHGYLKQDEEMASIWHDEIRRGVGSLGDYARATDLVTEMQDPIADALDGDLKVMQTLEQVTARLTARWRGWASEVTDSVGIQDAFVRVMTEAQGITRKQSRTVLNQMNAIDRLTTDGLTPLLEMQVKNLLALGDFEGAMRLLTGAFRAGIGPIKNYVNWTDTLEGRLADTAKAAFAAHQNLELLGQGGPGGGGGGGGGGGTGSNNGVTPGLADGGPAWRGRSYVVGERGPELFTPRVSGTVTPNGGGVTVTVNGDVYDGDAFEERVTRALRRARAKAGT